MNRIAVVVPFADDPSFERTVEAFAAQTLVSRVLVPHSGTFTARGTKVVAVAVDSWTSGHGLNSAA